MTKYEWERQLKKGISGLPKSEQQRVLDYYNELFADKIDAGMREQYIISEFGNPYDVANKILVDFYTDGKESPAADEYVYAPADEIDESFSEPKAKTEEKREEKEEHGKPEVTVKKPYGIFSGRSKPKYMAVETGEKPESKKTNAKSAGGLITIICVLIFFIIGACFNKWHPAWLIFVLMPVVITLAEAITRRNWRLFCYPLFVVFVYLLFGFYGHLWHPMWVLFITIPVYYVAGDYVTKNVKSKKIEEEIPSAEEKDEAPKTKEEEQVTTVREEKKAPRKKGGAQIFAGILLTFACVTVMVVVWALVISLFAAGIVMIAGGIGGIVWACLGMSASLNTSMIMLGGALAVLGLGLVLTFGIAGMFKACGKMCRELCGAIGRCFGKKENA